MTGVEIVGLLKAPSAAISSLLAVVNAIKDGAAHLKATKEYANARPALIALLEQLRALAVHQLEASSIITEFKLFSSGLDISNLSEGDIERKFERFNDREADQAARAEKWKQAIETTRMRSGEVWRQATTLDKLAGRRNVKNFFGLLNVRVDRLQSLREQLSRVAEDDHEVLRQYQAMWKAVHAALEEVKHALDSGDGSQVERLVAADAILSARAAEFRPVHEEAQATVDAIEAALEELHESAPS